MGRALFGSALERGAHYQLAGYDIYLGEVGLAVAALVVGQRQRHRHERGLCGARVHAL